ncbi:MAG: hypothetical protein WCT14_03680 [Treponemataceae bacterium]
MKKRTIARLSAFLTVFFLAVASAASLDFGLSLTNDSDYLYEGDWSLVQANEAHVWLAVPFGSSNALYVSGLYEFQGTFNSTTSTLVPWRLDLGRTEFEGLLEGFLGSSSVFRYSVGRIAVEDFSNRVMSNLIDGFRAELSLNNFSIYLGAGYRGLTYKEDARSLIDEDDQTAYEDSSVYFAPKRVMANLGFRLNELVQGHDFGLEAWGQYDLESAGKQTHTAYVEPFFEGRFGRLFRWRGWCVAEFGYDGEFFKSVAAGGTVRLSIPEIIGFRVTGNVAWASGTNENFRYFAPIRQKQIVTVAAYPFSDILLTSLDLSASPLRRVTVGATGSALFRTTTNAPSSDALTKATVRTETSGYYLGFEPTARVAWQAAADLSFHLSGGVFIPNTVDIYTTDSPLRWKASINAAFNL